MKKSGIYCIENIINKKKYIGRSVNIYHRFFEHKSDLRKGESSCAYLQKAFNKYGEENFIFYVIEECEPEFLSEMEIFYINFYKTNERDKGYNLTNGGEGGLSGYNHSHETKLKIGAAHKGMKHKEESKRLMSLHHANISGENHYLYGKHMKKETLEKLSIARTGKNNYGYGKKTKGATSKYLGVYFESKAKKWVSRIRINKKLKHIGRFDTEIDAAMAYNKYIELNKLDNPINII